MTKQIIKAALFDFDGVVMDTEGQYTIYWDKQGEKYLNETDFGKRIKGQTLSQIYDKHFANRPEVQEQITAGLNAYEAGMSYEYLPGVETFLIDLRRKGIKTALVTSSNEVKMANVYAVHPEMKELFDVILTSEHFVNSKPHPECFLLAMKRLGAQPEESVVFEDSFHGLQAGRASGAKVVALATTNPESALKDKAHLIIKDFEGVTIEELMER